MAAPAATAGLRLLIAALCAAASPALSAAVTGYHDGTNASATWGWACDAATPAAHLTVVIKAYVNGSFGAIGAVVADRWREDVADAAVCGGTSNGNHGFVFTDYPPSLVDGQAHDLYAFAQLEGGALQLLGVSPLNLSLVPLGLWDQGLVNGRWRTDYFASAHGTAASPLQLDRDLAGGCWLAVPPVVPGGASPAGSGCLVAPTSYDVSNAASSDGRFDDAQFWVITANSEPAYRPAPGDGPPNQTDPVSAPGGGLYAVVTLPDAEGGVPSRRKAHLIINKNADPHVAAQRGPFLSYGLQSDWGNGHGAVTVLRAPGAPKTLAFAATLFDISPDQSHVNAAYLIVEAQWGGVKRWAYISLLDRHNTVNARASFNWNILGGLWFPGADIMFRDADDLNTTCRTRVPGWTPLPAMLTPAQTYVNSGAAARRSYLVDLELLFGCLSPDFLSPMPASGPIQITGVHFAIEQDFHAGNFTWVAFDSVALN